MQSDEKFEIVDEAGNVTGIALRSECHRNPELLHRAVHVLVITGTGELLLQLRRPDKDVQPDKWDSSVGGHIQPGESVEAAARREAAEELGLSDLALEFLYTYIWRTDRESELITTYRVQSDGPFTPQPEELADLRRWSSTEIEGTIGSGVFTPNFEHEWQMYCNYCSTADG